MEMRGDGHQRDRQDIKSQSLIGGIPQALPTRYTISFIISNVVIICWANLDFDYIPYMRP